MDQNHNHRSAPPGRVPPEATASTLVPSPEQLQFARVLGQALAERWREARVRPVGPLRKTPTTSPGPMSGAHRSGRPEGHRLCWMSGRQSPIVKCT